jgi:hypothetical protein
MNFVLLHEVINITFREKKKRDTKNYSFQTYHWRWLYDCWLVTNCFTSRSRIFQIYGDITNTVEGLQNVGLCSALRAFEQGAGAIVIVPHLQ